MHKFLIAVSAALSVATVSLAPASAATVTGPDSSTTAGTAQIIGEEKFSPDELLTAAKAQDRSSSGPTLTVEQVRSSFSSAGFRVEQPRIWDWTSPRVTSIEVRDQTRDRVLMVQIYESPGAAQTARFQAQAREQAQNPESVTSADGPHLVLGYGPSVWNGNVALLQTTQMELNRLYQLQSDRDNCVYRRREPPAGADPAELPS